MDQLALKRVISISVTYPSSSTPTTFHPALLNALASLFVSIYTRQAGIGAHVSPLDILPPLMITHPGLLLPVFDKGVLEILKSPFALPLSRFNTKHTATAARDTGSSSTDARGSTKPASRFCNLFGLVLGMVVAGV